MDQTPAPQTQMSSGSLDEVRYRARVRQLESEQNLFMGLMAGLGAALAGALIWALITYATGYQIGWMAVGVGFVVGYAVRLLGKGVTPVYGVVAAALAILGCVAGNVLTTCLAIAQQESMALSEVLLRLNPLAIPQLLAITFQPIDLLFYGLALYAAFQYGFERPSPEPPAQGASPA